MNYTKFTDDMKKDYTILVPTMLPMHFEMLIAVLREYGYNAELLKNEGDVLKNYGLKYVHNDTCYPAQVVIGQLIDAIENGHYDKNKIALLITQTGGGCRASNYISLLRKALDKAGYSYIPVLSLNFNGLDDSSIKLTIPMVIRFFYAIMLGDLLMTLKNQTMPYETEPRAEKLCDIYLGKISKLLVEKRLKTRTLKAMYLKIIKDFSKIPLSGETKTRVGIVGEIFVKFSPLGNNDLEKLLYEHNGEVVMGGLLDFCLYCVYNYIADAKLYGVGKIKAFVVNLVYRYLLLRQMHIIKLIKTNSSFEAPTPFEHTRSLIEGYIGIGMKMGEGWLLTAEMLELIEKGVKNIVCTQPFGCLPNHIAGKGMIKLIKENHPDVNIVAIDYDASASKVNQENRIKLMLSK